MQTVYYLNPNPHPSDYRTDRIFIKLTNHELNCLLHLLRKVYTGDDISTDEINIANDWVRRLRIMDYVITDLRSASGLERSNSELYPDTLSQGELHNFTFVGGEDNNADS